MMLTAAERVFARKGFREATIEEIAREADFAVGTFYNFFKGKSDLYKEVLGGIVRDFMAEFERDVESREDPALAVAALVELRLRIFEQHREFLRVFFEQSSAGMGGGLPREHLRQRARYKEAVRGIFARGVRSGVFAPLDPVHQAICLDGVINAMVRHWSAGDAGEPPAVRVDKTREIVLQLFCRPVEMGMNRA